MVLSVHEDLKHERTVADLVPVVDFWLQRRVVRQTVCAGFLLWLGLRP
jgi:hypothetical protein